MTHEQIIPLIVDKLKKYPEIKFEQKGNSELRIYPRDEKGFSLSISTWEKENTLGFGDAYHWHFENTESEQTEMLDQLAYGLMGLARIKVWTKYKKPYKWTLELQDQEGNWLVYGTTAVPRFNFWTKPEFYYLQNDLLPINRLRADY